jgi:CubicO group peptidase (beta-lactamase class C family)
MHERRDRKADPMMTLLVAPAMWLTFWLPSLALTPDYEAAADYSRRRGGRALVVAIDDRIVFERFQNGARDDFRQTVMSGTKAFGCALAAIAVADGLLDLDAPVAALLPDLAARPTSASITPRALLTQSSGLKGGGTPTRGDHYAWISKHARPLAGTPSGRRFTYGAAHWDLFAAALHARTGKDPIALLESRVLAPLGIPADHWKSDDAGRRFLAFGFVTTPRDWARYGMLLAAGGVADGRRLLPAEGVADCWRGSDANPAYGFGFWLNHPMPPEARQSAGLPTTLRRLVTDGRRGAILPGGPPDLAMAAGSADTRLYIVPSRRMVIVRFGSGDRPDFADAELLKPLLLPWSR